MLTAVDTLIVCNEYIILQRGKYRAYKGVGSYLQWICLPGASYHLAGGCISSHTWWICLQDQGRSDFQFVQTFFPQTFFCIKIWLKIVTIFGYECQNTGNLLKSSTLIMESRMARLDIDNRNQCMTSHFDDVNYWSSNYWGATAPSPLFSWASVRWYTTACKIRYCPL